ncbi:MAG: response regulator [Chloroflexi bacterium]|nr:MAG: response regulator [Chloroflexota bacterium]
MNSNRDIKVLIAEDNYLVSEMIKGSLKDIGYTIVGEAVDGIEAVEMTGKLKPDVVLMDIEMPEQNGIEASQRIFDQCPTPIVVLTAYETPELVSQASAAGVGAYLIKPPNAQELERAITIARARFNDSITLRRLNNALKNRNEELDTFAHTVSHNLQHSIDLILGYTNILKNQARLPEELEHYLNMVIRTGHTMTNVIDELQLLTGVRTTEVTVKPVNMSRIVAKAQQRLAHLISDKQAKIHFPAAWPAAYGYEPWIEEVWVNYLSNGIKYGGCPPHLQLGATERSDGMVRFWVRDNGDGISAEKQARLFAPFNRLDEVQIRGQGLGLSVVGRIVEKLGGQVGVESENIPGQGSTFYFTLPGAPQHRPHADDFA